MDEHLQKYINIKKKAEQKTMIGGLLVIVGVILFVLGFDISFILAIPLVLAGIIVGAIGIGEFSKLSKRFKADVVGNLVTTYVENGYFNPNDGLSQHQVYATEFLKHADRFHSEDFLRGKMDGVEFVSSDVKLEERHVEHTNNGTRTYYETYFLGRVFIFEFNKPFAGFLQVLERGRPHVNRGYDKIKLESIAFNKKFKTYTTNDHSAFYVLTPHFMEALMKFEQHNRGTVSFSFLGNNLYIGINNFRDTFELQMFRPLNQAVFDEFKRDLLVIKEVVSELRLNTNIFKKGE